MELNTKKFCLLTESIALEQTAELPLDEDITLPEHLGDISRILRCEATAFVTTKHLKAKALTVEGECKIRVLYCDNEGRLYCFNRDIPFKRSFEGDRALEGGNADVTAEGMVHNCRAISERTIAVKSSVKLWATATICEKNEVLTDIDPTCFEVLKGQRTTCSPIGQAQKLFIMDEELTLSGEKAALRLLRSECIPTVTESRILGDKIMVKGLLAVELTYCNGENELEGERFSLPFNQLLEIAGLKEDCSCEVRATLCGHTLTPRGFGGEACQSFMLIAKVELCATAVCTEPIPLIYDLYSTKYTATPTKGEVYVTDLIGDVQEAFLCKKSIEMPPESTLLDMWCALKGVYFKSEEKQASVGGELLVCGLYKNGEDEAKIVDYSIDFEYPFTITEPFDGAFCRPEIKIVEVAHQQKNGATELSVELLIRARVFSKSRLLLITDVTVEDTEQSKDSALVAYYADKGERVWDICKSFLTARQPLMELNKLSEEVLEQPRMLIIPLA